MKGMICVTGADLRELVKAAYALSSPQDLGRMHYREGPLDDETVDFIIQRGDERVPVYMDYVHGRSCKFAVYKEGDDLFICRGWYDHAPEHVEKLLEMVGISE